MIELHALKRPNMQETLIHPWIPSLGQMCGPYMSTINTAKNARYAGATSKFALSISVLI